MEIVRGKQYFEAPPLYTFSDLLEYVVAKYPQRAAVCYRELPQAQPIYKSYEQLYADCDALCHAFAAHGISSARIGIVGDNGYQWMLAYLAAVRSGHVVVPLDRLLTGEELAILLRRGELDVLFFDAGLSNELLPHVQADLGIKLWVSMLEQRQKKTDKLEQMQSKIAELERCYQPFASLLQTGEEQRSRFKQSFLERPSNEMIALLFTSGTTSTSKAVMLSAKAILADVRALLETVKFKDPLKSLSLLPLHHTFENTCGFLTVLAIGGCIHIYDGLRYVAQNMQEYGVDMVIGVPTLFELIYKKIIQKINKENKMRQFTLGLKLARFLRFFGIDIRRKLFREVLAGLGGNFYIAISGAAALDVEIIKFFDNIGISILQGYGMTETAPVVAGCNTQLSVPGTVGQALSGVQIAIANSKAGEAGEILLKGDMLMLGYYGDEESTREALDEEGWLHSGDIGYFSPKDKCLRITGRTKSMIVLPSGKKVFPEELEQLLNRNKFVRDSLVFTQEDENGDMVLTAKIVLDQQSIEEEYSDDWYKPEFIKQTLEGYLAKANELLPSFKGVRSYAYSFKDMVKTTTLKVRRSIETEKIKSLIAKSKLTWREFTGQNLDQLAEPEESVELVESVKESEAATVPANDPDSAAK